jgi:hypothetical protein
VLEEQRGQKNRTVAIVIRYINELLVMSLWQRRVCDVEPREPIILRSLCGLSVRGWIFPISHNGRPLHLSPTQDEIAEKLGRLSSDCSRYSSRSSCNHKYTASVSWSPFTLPCRGCRAKSTTAKITQDIMKEKV